MELTEKIQLLQACLELQAEILKQKPEDRPFVVCIEGTNRAFFNVK